MEDDEPLLDFSITGDDGELFDPVEKPKRKSKSSAVRRWWLAMALSLLGFVAGGVVYWLNSPRAAVEPTETLSLSAQEYSNRGVASKALGDYDSAIVDFTLAIEVDPNYAGAYNNRAMTYYLTNQNDLALADFNRAIQLNPRSALYHNNRGELYFRRFDDRERALVDFDRALELDASLAIAYNNRGNVYNDPDAQTYTQAIEDYTRAIALLPDYYEAYTNRANAYLRLGDLDSAEADANRAIEINPQFARAYGARGSIALTRGDQAAALADLREFVRLASANENPDTLNQVREVIRELEAAVEVTPE